MENRTAPQNDMSLRACRDYRPSEHLVKITYREEGQPERQGLYLDVSSRIAWFTRYCEEKGCTGSIADSDVEVIPELQLVIVRASVTLNGEVVGKSAASWPLSDPKAAVQRAATTAKGRALANAGFLTAGEYREGTGTRKDAAPAPDQPLSLEDAERTLITFGMHKGRTLGELLAEAPEDVAWYAGPEFKGRGGTGKIKTAAQRLLGRG